MGCAAPQISSSSNPLPSLSPISDNLPQKAKKKISDIIQKNNTRALALALKQFGGAPTSLLSETNRKWMTIHICCQWDADSCLQYLLKDFYMSNAPKYIDFVNAKNSEGHTCLHLCSIWKSQKCFIVLQYYGGLYLQITDNKQLTAYDHALEYKFSNIRTELGKYKAADLKYLKMKVEKLKSMELMTSQGQGEGKVFGKVDQEESGEAKKKKQEVVQRKVHDRESKESRESKEIVQNQKSNQNSKEHMIIETSRTDQTRLQLLTHKIIQQALTQDEKPIRTSQLLPSGHQALCINHQ